MKGPVVKAAGHSKPPIAELPARRVTRSRAAAANVMVNPRECCPQHCLCCPPGPAMAAAIAPPPVVPAPPAPTASTRVTRAGSCQPPAPHRASTTTSGAPTTARRTRTTTSHRTSAAWTRAGPRLGPVVRWCCSRRVPAKGTREAAAAARETETDHSVASVLVSDACANTDFTACIVAVVVIGLYGLAVSYLPSRSLRHLCRIATVAMPVDHWSTSGSQVRRTAAM